MHEVIVLLAIEELHLKRAQPGSRFRAVLEFSGFGFIWESPKIGDPNIVPSDSRILMIRTPK